MWWFCRDFPRFFFKNAPWFFRFLTVIFLQPYLWPMAGCSWHLWLAEPPMRHHCWLELCGDCFVKIVFQITFNNLYVNRAHRLLRGDVFYYFQASVIFWPFRRPMNQVVMWCFIADPKMTAGLLHLGRYCVSVSCTWAGGGTPQSNVRISCLQVKIMVHVEYWVS